MLEVYTNTDIDVGLPGWTRVAGHNAVDELPTGPLLVITAFNPGDARPDEAANVQANAELALVLSEMGGSVLPAIGRERGGDHEEPSWAVTGLSIAAVQSVAKLIGQRAIFHVTPDELRTILADGTDAHAQPRVLVPASPGAPCTVRVTCGDDTWLADIHADHSTQRPLDLTKPTRITGEIPVLGWLTRKRAEWGDIDDVYEHLDEDAWFEHQVLAPRDRDRWTYNGTTLAALVGGGLVPWPEDPEVIVERSASWGGWSPGTGGWARSVALRLADDVALISWNRDGDTIKSHALVGATTEAALWDAVEDPILEEIHLSDDDEDDDPASALSDTDLDQIRAVLELAEDEYNVDGETLVRIVHDIAAGDRRDTLLSVARLSRQSDQDLRTCLRLLEDSLAWSAEHGLDWPALSSVLAELLPMAIRGDAVRLARLAEQNGRPLLDVIDLLDTSLAEIKADGLADSLLLARRILMVAPVDSTRYRQLTSAVETDTLADWLDAVRRWSDADTQLAFSDALDLTLNALYSGATIRRDQVVESLQRDTTLGQTRVGFMAADSEYHCWPDAAGRDEDGLWLDPQALALPRGRDGWHRIVRDRHGRVSVRLGSEAGQRRPDHHTVLAVHVESNQEAQA